MHMSLISFLIPISIWYDDSLYLLVWLFLLFSTEFYILENNAVLKEAVIKKKNSRTEIKMLHIEDYGKFRKILF